MDRRECFGMTRIMFASTAVVAAVLLAGCGHGDQAGQGQSTTSASPPTVSIVPSSSVPSLSPSPSTRSAQPEPAEPASPTLADGRYAAYLTAIDTRARAVTFDVIQYLTGEEAAKAFHRDNPDIPEGPPNNFYIVNRNPRLRTMPVYQNVHVEVIWMGSDLSPKVITFDQLPGYCAKNPVKDKYVWYDPFWLDVRDGRIDAITEQYIP